MKPSLHYDVSISSLERDLTQYVHLNQKHSIYLWGSVISLDYNSLKSDIDIMIISQEHVGVFLEEELRKKLQNNSRLRIRIIEFEELVTGKIRSPISKLIHPKLLALDFRHWVHLSGDILDPQDLYKCTIREAIHLRINAIHSRHIPFCEKKLSGFEFLCKELFRLLHLVSQIYHGDYPFSYSDIKYVGVIKLDLLINRLTIVRKSGYDIKYYKEILDKVKVLNKVLD